VKIRELTSDDDFLILGCDGIWESMTNQEIIDFVGRAIAKKDQGLSKIAGDLLDKNLAPDTTTGMGCDNMTCIIVTLKWINRKWVKNLAFLLIKVFFHIQSLFALI